MLNPTFAEDKNNPSDTFKIRAGNIQLKNNNPCSDDHVTLVLDGRIVTDYNYPAGSIVKIIKAKHYDAIFLNMSMCGSGTTDTIHVINIRANGISHIFKNELMDNKSDELSIPAQVNNDTIHLDLGLVTKKHKYATLEFSKIKYTTKKATYIDRLPEDYCRELYDSFSYECNKTLQSNCNLISHDTATRRTLYDFDDYPGFSLSSYEFLCKLVCKYGIKSIRYTKFHRSVCGK